MEKSLVKICQNIVDQLYEEKSPEGLIERELGALAEKVDSYVSFYRYLDAQIEFLKAEVEHLNQERTRLENAKVRLKERAKVGMNLLDTQKLKGERGSTIFFKTTERVDIFDENQVPEQFWRVTKEVSKELVKAAIKSGQDVPGARIIENETIVFR